jgi:outer membrane protein assembly factor BamB
VIVTCSSGPRQERLHVVCLGAADGKTLWQRQLWATGHTICHPFGAVAGPTPASDGRLVFAFYSSNDLVCFDLEGNLKWFRGLAHESPATRNDVGMASSPLVVGQTVVVQSDCQGASFVAGIDAQTGRNRWRIERDTGAVWSSPMLLRGKRPADDLVLLHGRGRLSAHDPQTGRQVAAYEASCSTVSTVAVADSTAYLPAGGVHALRYDAATGSFAKVWQDAQRLRCDNCSPVVYEGRVYAVKSPGIVVCADAADGKTLWQLRLKGPFWATPLAADGRLYCVSHAGLAQIVDLSGEGKLLGTAQLDEGMLASPIAANGAVYFRSDAHLWKIAAKPKP